MHLRLALLFCFALRVLTFFIAGLLYLLCLEHVDNLERTSIPSGRPAFSSHLFSTINRYNVFHCIASGGAMRPSAVLAISLTLFLIGVRTHAQQNPASPELSLHDRVWIATQIYASVNANFAL